MTSIGARHLLLGGFDGKSTFGDLWWLVPEGKFILTCSDVLHTSSVLSLDDPIAKRSYVRQLLRLFTTTLPFFYRFSQMIR